MATSLRIRRVAVIGAGPSGLAAVKYVTLIYQRWRNSLGSRGLCSFDYLLTVEAGILQRKLASTPSMCLNSEIAWEESGTTVPLRTNKQQRCLFLS